MQKRLKLTAHEIASFIYRHLKNHKKLKLGQDFVVFYGVDDKELFNEPDIKKSSSIIWEKYWDGNDDDPCTPDEFASWKSEYQCNWPEPTMEAKKPKRPDGSST